VNLALSEVSTQNILNQLAESGQKTLGLLSQENIKFISLNKDQLVTLSEADFKCLKVAKCLIQNNKSRYIIFISFNEGDVYPFIKNFYSQDEITSEVCGEWSCEILNMIAGDLIGHFSNVQSIKFDGEIPNLVLANDIKNFNRNNLVGSFGLMNNNRFSLDLYKL